MFYWEEKSKISRFKSKTNQLWKWLKYFDLSNPNTWLRETEGKTRTACLSPHTSLAPLRVVGKSEVCSRRVNYYIERLFSKSRITELSLEFWNSISLKPSSPRTICTHRTIVQQHARPWRDAPFSLWTSKWLKSALRCCYARQNACTSVQKWYWPQLLISWSFRLLTTLP